MLAIGLLAIGGSSAAERWAGAQAAPAGLTRSELAVAVEPVRARAAALSLAVQDGDEAAAAALAASLTRDAARLEAALTLETQRPQHGPTAAAEARAALDYLRAGARDRDGASLEHALWYLERAARLPTT